MPKRTSTAATPTLASRPTEQVSANRSQPFANAPKPRSRWSAYVSALLSTKLKVIATSAASVWPISNSVNEYPAKALPVAARKALSTAICTITPAAPMVPKDRKSTRLNSSHVEISYAVFCLKKKKKKTKKYKQEKETQ